MVFGERVLVNGFLGCEILVILVCDLTFFCVTLLKHLGLSFEISGPQSKIV